MKITVASEEEADEGIPMAPLIDCVFLLLIFFLVATTLKEPRTELPLELPPSAVARAGAMDRPTLRLGLDAGGNRFLDEERIMSGRLIEAARTFAESHPDGEVRIAVDRSAAFDSLIEILDILSFEGLERIGFEVRRKP